MPKLTHVEEVELDELTKNWEELAELEQDARKALMAFVQAHIDATLPK